MGEGIEDLTPLRSSNHEAAVAKTRNMFRGGGLSQAQLADEVTHSRLTGRESPDNREAIGVCE